MAINKFVDRQGNTLLDLSVDSVSPNKVLAGTTYHGPDGLQHTGTLDPGPLDYSQYNFIDYDGTLLYSYTDEEIDALEVLPEVTNHTGDNLTFQGWNVQLADLKLWDRTRPVRPLIGANYVTTDGKTYLYLDTPYADATLSFDTNGTINSVDWGDGTVDTNKSHVHTNPGKYVIAIDVSFTNGGYVSLGSNNPSTSTNKQWIKMIKLGNVTNFANYRNCYSLQSITIPRELQGISNNLFSNCYSLQNITIPYLTTSIPNSLFSNCYSLKNVSIPNGVTSIGAYAFSECYSLQNILIPDLVTTIDSYALEECHSLHSVIIPNRVTSMGTGTFYDCYSLQNVIIPNSVTDISGQAFAKCNPLTIDLSKQTKVINIASTLGLNTNSNKILIPNALLSDYKSASNWSQYASIMVGV